MPGSQNTAQTNKFLTNVSNKIVPMGYISEKILPLIEVKQTTGKIGGYGTSHLRIETTLTIGKNKTPMVDTRTYTSENYEIEKHSLGDLVTEEDRANVEQPFDANEDTTDELTTHLWLEKEFGLASQLGNTGVITNNVTLSGTSQYNDYTNSTPLTDFSTARDSIFSNVGMPPNIVIMSYAVFNVLRYHPDLLTSLGYNQQRPGGLSNQEIAKALDVERIEVGTAVYDSAKEGQASAVNQVWGKNIIFAVAPTAAKKRQISLGYRLQQFGAPRKVYKSRQDNPVNSDLIIVQDHYQQLISQTDAAYLIKDAVA